MKKLGKKTNIVEMTIEAYASNCSCGTCVDFDCRSTCRFKLSNEVGHLHDKREAKTADTKSSTRVKPK